LLIDADGHVLEPRLAGNQKVGVEPRKLESLPINLLRALTDGDKFVTEKLSSIGGTVQLKEAPSYYFKRQCFISADPDERSIEAMTRLVGADRFFWASDYPHPDHPGNYLEELRGLVAGMTATARRGVLGENVARCYKLL
jgi:hypothetical protein